MNRALRLAALALGISATPAASQAPELARIDTLVAAGRFTDARSTLQRWLDSPAAKQAPATDAAHALLLRGQLSIAGDSALQHYLELALNYPATQYAPDGLLRLGQGYSALGEAERAAGYLERLVRDYPTYPQRNVGRLWLARAQRDRRRPGDACNTLQLALRDSIGSDLRALLEAERASCNAATPPAAAAAAAGAFTIQAGAFRDRAAALALAKRLTDRGIDARVVYVGAGTLAQVRAGRFRNSADATDLLRRVRGIVPDAVIVSDAARERNAAQ